MEEFLNRLWLDFHKALLNFIKKNISNPEDIANAFLYLCSDMGKYVTGTTLSVDGGVIS